MAHVPIVRQLHHNLRQRSLELLLGQRRLLRRHLLAAAVDDQLQLGELRLPPLLLRRRHRLLPLPFLLLEPLRRGQRREELPVLARVLQLLFVLVQLRTRRGDARGEPLHLGHLLRFGARLGLSAAERLLHLERHMRTGAGQRSHQPS